MENKSIWTLLVIAGVLVCAYIFGQSSKAVPQAITATASDVAPLVSNADNPELSIDDKSIKDGWSVILLGSDPVTKDSTTFSYSVKDLGDKIEGYAPWDSQNPLRINGGVTTTGEFMQVDLTFNNNGTEGEGIQATIAGLFDQDGRGYQLVNTDGKCDSIGVRYLQPDIPCTTHALFEVSKASNSFNLKLYYKNAAN